MALYFIVFSKFGESGHAPSILNEIDKTGIAHPESLGIFNFIFYGCKTLETSTCLSGNIKYECSPLERHYPKRGFGQKLLFHK